MKLKGLLALSLLSLLGLAQNKIEYKPSAEIFEEANEAYANEDYDEAFRLYGMINENDSAYFEAKLNQGLAASELDHFDSVRVVLEEGLSSKLYNYRKPSFYNNLVHAYIQMENYDKALSLVNEALELYPMMYLLHFNKAAVLENQERYDEALYAIQTCIRFNPKYPKAHIKLGQLCERAGDLTKAALAYNGASMYGALEPLGAFVVFRLEQMYDGEKPEEGPITLNYLEEENFDEIDELIKNQLAKNKQYKVKTKLPFSYVKSNHLLFEKIQYNPNDNGFFNQHYVRIFKEVFDEGHFATYSYFQCLSLEHDKTQKLVKKKLTKIKLFYQDFSGRFLNYMNERMIRQEDGSYVKNLLKHGGDYGFVEQFKEVDGRAVGKYIGYEKGMLSKEGQFNTDHKEEGEWKFYKEGRLSIQADLVDGVLDGERISYLPNGSRDTKMTFRDGELKGTVYNYYTFDELFNEVPLNSGGNREGVVKYYHKNGKLKHLINYIDGKRQGTCEEYYDNGQLTIKFEYKDDEIDGEYKGYHRNGTPSVEGQFQSGKRVGDWKFYHDNGNVKEEGSYVNGDQAGVWKTYYVDGKLEEEVTYGETGKRKGTYKSYDIEGLLELEYEYKGDEIISYKCYGEEGKVLSEGEKTKKQLEFTRFNYIGSKTIEGQFEKDHPVGKWKYYDDYGVLSRTKEYNDDGELDGYDQTFFEDGSVDAKATYKEGLLEGYYEEYFQNGKMYCQGNYEEGERVGLWVYYYPNGNEKSTYYYQNGMINGVVKYYDEKGYLEEEVFYYNDLFQRSISYDSTGTAYHDVALNLGKGEMVYLDRNGELLIRNNYLGGEKHGEETRYYNNGKIRSKGSYFNGNETGVWTFYNRIGEKVMEGSYLDGERNGEWNWYENGKLTGKANYVNGEYHGERLWYAWNGNVEHRINYHYGQKHGERIYYDNEGNIAAVKFYRDDILIGYAEANESGEIKEMQSFDVIDGLFETKYPNGNKALVYKSKNGDLDGVFTLYHANGKVKELYHYDRGVRHGDFATYYASGKPSLEGHYENGQLQGKVNSYYPNGKLKSTLNYELDELYGTAIYYNQNGTVREKVYYYNGRVIR